MGRAPTRSGADGCGNLCEIDLRAKEKRSEYGIGASAGAGSNGCCTGTSTGRVSDDSGISRGSERRAMGKASQTRGDVGAGAFARRSADDPRISGWIERRSMGEAAKTQEAMALLEPLREEELTTEKTHVGANAERWEKPLRHEAATMVLEPLRKEAWTKVGASGELGAPCSGTADGGKREMEPLWNEATMIASSWPVMGRPLREEALT